MQETKKDTAVGWVLRLARENPELFGRGGGWKISVQKEPQVSSHSTRIYKVDGAKVHVKFFRKTLGRTGTTYDPCREMESEYRTLKEYERRGFTAGRYQVARALGVSEEADCALATLYVSGQSLLSIITGTIEDDREDADLYMGLELAAGMLNKIHTVMTQSYSVDHCEMFYSYLKSIIYLEDREALDGYHRRITKGLAGWYSFQPLFKQHGVTVHGDANPSNFKIDDGIIYTFDVESSRPRRSACVDIAAMIAELVHQCAYLGGDSGRAQPFIQHFLRAYEPDENARKQLERILPFFVSQSLLKIAMLGYWTPSYRKFLVEEGTRQIEVRPA